MLLLSHCNTDRTCFPLPITTTEKSSTSQILKIFSDITARIVAPPNDGFRICSLHWKWLFFPGKTLQTPSKSAYKYRRNLLLK